MCMYDDHDIKKYETTSLYLNNLYKARRLANKYLLDDKNRCVQFFFNNRFD